MYEIVIHVMTLYPDELKSCYSEPLINGLIILLSLMIDDDFIEAIMDSEDLLPCKMYSNPSRS